MPVAKIPHEAFEILDAIERRGNFAKAAEELGKATSAISYGVTKLEERLGITIFERHGRRAVLTPAGQLLLQEGRIILDATDRLALRAQELANGWEPVLRIAVEATFDQRLLFAAIAEFQSDHPAIEIDIQETLLNGSWEALQDKQVDLLVGAVGPVPRHQGFRTQALAATDLVPVVSQALAQGLPDLSETSYQQLQHVVNHDTATNEVARSEGLTLGGRQTLYVQTREQKTQAILAGLGVGHLPLHRIQKFLQDGKLIQLETTPTNPKQYLAWHLTNKGKALSALVDLLTEALLTEGP